MSVEGDIGNFVRNHLRPPLPFSKDSHPADPEIVPCIYEDVHPTRN